MNMSKEPLELVDPQYYREIYIRELDKCENKTKYAKENSESLYALGLTMYSNVFSFNSALYNAFSVSYLDNNVSLHPEQLKAIEIMSEHRGMVFSAPTSFGKTFVIFEYIAKYKPTNIVLVVPTLALVDEYKRKIINQYRSTFSSYKVYLSIEKDKEYDFNCNNLFLVTHDRVINEEIKDIINEIDFLVIDEVYKLQKDESDDRVLILNLAYYNLVSISKKYVLLAPFISGVENLQKLDDIPVFYGTNYSPVVNEVITCPVISDDDRVDKTREILEAISGNTLIYFPTVNELNDFIENIDSDYSEEDDTNSILHEFIVWARNEIHEQWSVLKAIESGYLVHHGQLPLGIRMLQLDLFNNNSEKCYQRMLCTATLLEGVNTIAENIIITKPARGNNKDFDAFDFYNLVGRTGRLFQHYLGKAYYIKAPNDSQYLKEEALKSIEFELTSDSIDIDINNNNYEKHQNFIDFLDLLNIDYETYKLEIASKCRFSTVLFLYNRYIQKKEQLFNELERQINNNNISKLEMIRRLYEIISNSQYLMKLQTYIINRLTYLTNPRPKIKSIVDSTVNTFSWANINDVIKRTISLKNSYIEYEFYKRIQIIQFFMQCERQNPQYIDIIHDKLTRNIEILYYINSPSRKMLKDMGIYDSDIEMIIDIIGDDYDTVDELQKRIINKKHMLNKIGIVSKYVINRFIV